MRTRFYVLLGVASVALAPMVVTAAVVLKMDTADLARGSHLIIQGTVVGSDVQWEDGPNGPMNFRTVTTIQVDRTFKGAPAGVITVVEPGGTVAGLTQSWPGIPRFNLGEEAILFLQRMPNQGLLLPGLQPGDLTVFGLEQGHMTIREQPGAGKVVTQSFDGLKFHGSAIGIEATPKRSLKDVVAEIENTVAAQRGGTDKEGGR
ncbi:MAG: hypothetical protein V3W34_05370 [Phycisphaerae bacterium]